MANARAWEPVSGVRVPQDVFFQEVEDEVVLLNLQTGMYHGLDKVGSRVWGLLCHHCSASRCPRRFRARCPT